MSKFVGAVMAAFCLFLSGAPAADVQPAPAWTEGPKNEVVVLGTIHGTHRTSTLYSLDVLSRVIEAVDPDYVITEIPPDRLAAAAAGFASTGRVTEPRVRVFPEYTDVLFPLTRSMDFRIIPAAAWSDGMAAFRRDALARLSNNPARAKDWAAYQSAFRTFSEALGGRADDPVFIHSEEYDALTREAFRPYATLFAEDLGRGDWERINAAHYALIEAALHTHEYEGVRILITFGSSHKYWFLDRLRERHDIVLVDPVPFFEAAAVNQ